MLLSQLCVLLPCCLETKHFVANPRENIGLWQRRGAKLAPPRTQGVWAARGHYSEVGSNFVRMVSMHLNVIAQRSLPIAVTSYSASNYPQRRYFSYENPRESLDLLENCNLWPPTHGSPETAPNEPPGASLPDGFGRPPELQNGLGTTKREVTIVFNSAYASSLLRTLGVGVCLFRALRKFCVYVACHQEKPKILWYLWDLGIFVCSLPEVLRLRPRCIFLVCQKAPGKFSKNQKVHCQSYK